MPCFQGVVLLADISKFFLLNQKYRTLCLLCFQVTISKEISLALMPRSHLAYDALTEPVYCPYLNFRAASVRWQEMAVRFL